MNNSNVIKVIKSIKKIHPDWLDFFNEHKTLLINILNSVYENNDQVIFPNTKDIFRLFEDGEEVVVFKNKEDLLDNMMNYLKLKQRVPFFSLEIRITSLNLTAGFFLIMSWISSNRSTKKRKTRGIYILV